jgi:hypothetical protein
MSAVLPLLQLKPLAFSEEKAGQWWANCLTLTLYCSSKETMSFNEPVERVVRNHLLHAGFLLGLLFDPEDGGDMFLRNVG